MAPRDAPLSAPDRKKSSDAAKGDGLGGCGSIPTVGCCKGDILYYCSTEGALVKVDCTAEPHCGWESDFGNYDCATAGLAEPSGKHPLLCP